MNCRILLIWALFMARPLSHAIAAGFNESTDCARFVAVLEGKLNEKVYRGRASADPAKVAEFIRRQSRARWLDDVYRRTNNARLTLKELLRSHQESMLGFLIELDKLHPELEARRLAKEFADAELQLRFNKTENNLAMESSTGAENSLRAYLRPQDRKITRSRLATLERVITIQALLLMFRHQFFMHLSDLVPFDRRISDATREEINDALENTNSIERMKIRRLPGTPEDVALVITSARETSEAMVHNDRVPVALRAFYEDFIPFLQFLERYPNLTPTAMRLFVEPFAHSVHETQSFLRGSR